MTASYDSSGNHGVAAAVSSETSSEFEILEVAVRELAIEHGLFSAADHRQWLEWMDSASPALGARLAARAWVDPAFKKRALISGTAAAQQIGIVMYDRDPLVVMENTSQVHNLVVCTLCSCYPRAILGLPPRLVQECVLSKACRALAAATPGRIRDCHSTGGANSGSRFQRNMRYLVMPMRPQGTEDWSEEQLASIVTRDTMMGVAVPMAMPPSLP